MQLYKLFIYRALGKIKNAKNTILLNSFEILRLNALFVKEIVLFQSERSNERSLYIPLATIHFAGDF